MKNLIIKYLAKDKFKILGVIIIIIVIGTIYQYNEFNKEPIEIVNEYSQSLGQHWQVDKVIEQIEIDKKTILMFYLNEDNELFYAILEKRLFRYVLLDVGGSLDIYNISRPYDYHFSFYNQLDGWLCYGVLHDDAIDKLLVGGKETQLINVNGLRLWYLSGVGEIDYYNRQIFDKKGNELD